MAKSQGLWRTAHQEPIVHNVVVTKAESSPSAPQEERAGERRPKTNSNDSNKQPSLKSLSVKVLTGLPNIDAEWETEYTIFGSGDVIVAARFKPNKTDLPKIPRLGMQMALPKGFERLTWLGPGPQETYCDRKDARLGLYNGMVRDQFYADYTEPGESGNKVDVRWVSLTDARGAGLLAIGMPLLSVNALHHTTDDLQNAKHPFELPLRNSIVLNLDLKQQGLGGDNSWGAWPHQEFLIPCQEYNYSFRLHPLKAGEDPAKVARMSLVSRRD